MIEYTNSQDINHRSIEYQKKTSTANAVRIAATASTSAKIAKEATRSRCHHCKSTITHSNDILDLNGKRHFCDGAGRIRHEEKCVIKIQKIIEYYNRHELSSFQLGLKMDD
jgi:hypothetical protein